jgi:integrase
LERYVDTASFKVNRAALLFGLHEGIRLALAKQETLRGKRETELEWLVVIYLLKVLLAIQKAIQASPLDAACWDSVKTKKRRGAGKKDALKKISSLHPRWKEEMLLGMRRTKYVDACEVLALIGCRPEELEMGVEVRRHDDRSFALWVKGAKVGPKAGQPLRGIVLCSNRLPASWAKRLAEQPCFLVQVKSKGALRKSMVRVSEKLFPGLPALTPYVLRHAAATRLREEGKVATEVGAVLGHAVAETSGAYGFRRTRGKRRQPEQASIIDVQTARPVRPADRSGLEGVLAKKKHRNLKSDPGRT